jgi:hypothetical protein
MKTMVSVCQRVSDTSAERRMDLLSGQGGLNSWTAIHLLSAWKDPTFF